MDTSSLNKIKKMIEREQASDIISYYSESLKASCPNEQKVTLYLSLAIAKLSLQLTDSCIHDCESSIAIEPTSFAFLIKGIAELWKFDEDKAVESWKEGLKLGGMIRYFNLMNILVSNFNMRSYLFTVRFRVVELLDFMENFDKDIIYDNSDTQSAFAELKDNSLISAINHFNLIISTNPNNIQAYKGRGLAECLVGQWKKSIKDLTNVINSQVSVAECCKYRAVAYAALGYYSAAVTDLTVAINKRPNDFEAILERAKLQMIRNNYSLALNDFRKVPEKYYDSKIYTAVAECFYALGDIQKALHTILCADSTTDHRTFYYGYLIKRDQGDINDAALRLMKAIELLPSFFLTRTAGDFMYECGIFRSSILYYKNAISQKENDVDTLYLLALSLFQSGDEIEAIKILQKLSEHSQNEEDEIDFCQNTYNNLNINGDLRSFNKKLLSQSTIKSAREILKTLINLINHKNDIITQILFENDNLSIPNDFHFMSNDLTEIEKRMLSDAFRLGMKCMPFVPEIIANPRIIRCLGFCVLHMAQQIRTRYIKKEISWRDAIIPLQTIMSYSDLKNDIKWIFDGSDINEEFSPTFYLHKGERKSPRFGNVIKNAINCMKSSFKEIEKMISPSETSQFSSLGNLYSHLQQDYVYSHKLSNNEGDLLSLPTIHLNYLGCYGYDLFIKPPLDKDELMKYSNFIQEEWNFLLQNPDTEMSFHLSLVILIIWITQPLSHFSNEIGHVIFHSYLLALKDIEVERIPSTDGELFINQLVQTSPKLMNQIIFNHIKTKATKSEVAESSLNYWSSLPTIEQVFNLLNYVENT